MKHLCELSKKGVDKNLEKILKAIEKPLFICQKCARAANEKGRLCKPARISTLSRKK